MRISVCIPTYNRLDHLKQAITSCLTQTYKPFEIIISNDSSNDDSEHMIKKLQADRRDISIRYIRNKPCLKQAKNVNQLFEIAHGEFIVLLHDDNVLHKNALETFKSCFDRDKSLDIVFGKQYLMDHDGQVNMKKTEALNALYYRTSHYERHPLEALEAGFVQQFPNDGYILRSRVAKENRYDEKANDACDYEFGLRLGLKHYKMRFVDCYTSYFRISHNSISTHTGNDAALTAYQIAKRTPVPESSIDLKNKWMVYKSPMACMQAIKLRTKKEAFSIYFDPWHRKTIWTLGGIKRLLTLLLK